MVATQQQKRDAMAVIELEKFIFEACTHLRSTIGIIAFTNVTGKLLASLSAKDTPGRANMVAIAKDQIDHAVSAHDTATAAAKAAQ